MWTRTRYRHLTVDRFSDEALREPYPIYAALRSRGRSSAFGIPTFTQLAALLTCEMRCEQTTFC
ncbi:hypothetical protein ACVI1L_003696 [Bradyrhizobium sp. USDA 4516]